MKKINLILIYTFTFLHICTRGQSQNIGINPTGATPNASAMLDVSATDKGMLIPRVSLTSTTDVSTIANPATSLLVYNTNAGMSNGSVGFYYWNGTVWVKLNDANVSNSNGLWTANGNNISNSNLGHVGIGTSTPSTPLHVKGQQAITLPNGGVETSNVTALINDTTTSSGTGSKIGLYSIVKNHSAANVGVLAEAITKDSTNNFGIIGNIIGSGQTGGMAYAIGAVDAVKNGTGALYIDGQARYAGVPNTNEAGTVIANNGNGTMQWSKAVAFKAVSIFNPDTLLYSNSVIHAIYYYKRYDLSNSYDSTTGKFTAPLAGVYHFDYSGLGSSPTNWVDIGIVLSVNGFFEWGTKAIFSRYLGNQCTAIGSADIFLNVGDQVNVSYTNEGGEVYVSGGLTTSNFSGHLIR